MIDSGVLNSNSVPTIFYLCTLHQEAIRGKLRKDQFSAALPEMTFDHKHAPEGYDDLPVFFQKMHPTDGLQQLFQLLVKRYVDVSTEEFSQTPSFLSLDTVFGGRTTHSQIASYHFSQNPDSVENLQDFLNDGELVRQFKAITESINIRVGVSEGGYMSSTSTDCIRGRSALGTQTLWGAPINPSAMKDMNSFEETTRPE